MRSIEMQSGPLMAVVESIPTIAEESPIGMDIRCTVGLQCVSAPSGTARAWLAAGHNATSNIAAA
jgi:hypothetical protein